MPQSIETLSPNTQLETSEMQPGPFEKTLVLYDRDPRVINKLLNNWTGPIENHNFDNNAKLTNQASDTVLSQQILYQEEFPLIRIRRHAQFDIPPRITVFAQSQENLNSAVERLNEMFDYYEAEIANEPEHQAVVIENEDTVRHKRWIEKLLSHPSNRAFKKPFFYNPGLPPQ